MSAYAELFAIESSAVDMTVGWHFASKLAKFGGHLNA
jgi:hypothetical protein